MMLGVAGVAAALQPGRPMTSSALASSFGPQTTIVDGWMGEQRSSSDFCATNVIWLRHSHEIDLATAAAAAVAAHPLLCP